MSGPQGDAFKTLFVSRISFETTEKKLRREFEEYGPIKRLRLVHDATGACNHQNLSFAYVYSCSICTDVYGNAAGKPRGYAFIEYEHKNNMKEAYKRADGKKVEGRRIVVDVERGRTVPNWSAFWSTPYASKLHLHMDLLCPCTIYVDAYTNRSKANRWTSPYSCSNALSEKKFAELWVDRRCYSCE